MRPDLPLPDAGRYSLGGRVRHIPDAVRRNNHDDDHNNNDHNDHDNNDNVDHDDDPAVRDLHIRPGVRIGRCPG